MLLELSPRDFFVLFKFLVSIFITQDPDVFEDNISPDSLIPILSHILGQTIVIEKTLIVFDEVQICERALTSLKYFCEEAPDYHIIVAGTFLRVAVNRTKFSFSVGKVDIKTMYPMDM